MGNVCKFKLNKNKSMLTFALINICVLSGSLVSANASIIRRVSSVASSIGNVTNRSQNVRRVSSPLSRSSQLNSTLDINNLNQRLTEIETQRTVEQQRPNHPFNKLVANSSGVLSGAMLVTGVVGGIVQQAKFREMVNEQAYESEQVQKDLTEKRDHFQNVEIPEAEDYIINYYKENYGIDITQKN